LVYPKILLSDPLGEEIVNGQYERIKELPGNHHSNIETYTSLSFATTSIRNSKGLLIEWDHTLFSSEARLNKVLSKRLKSRRIPHKEEIETLFRKITSMESLIGRFTQCSKGLIKTLLIDRAADAFVTRLILTNLLGSNIVRGRSIYRREDFEEKTAVGTSYYNVTIDTSIDFGVGSSPCSSDGMPSGRFQPVVKGRLISPIVSLGSSHDLGFPPTPVPSSPEAVQFPLYSGSLNDMVSSLDRALVISEAMGLNTLDPLSGDYLIKPVCGLVVREGKLVGMTKCILSGNFFQALHDERFSCHSLEDGARVLLLRSDLSPI